MALKNTRHQSVFRYKTIKGPLHKFHAIIKLIMLLPLSIFSMSLSSYWLTVGIAAALFTSFFCRFTFNEQLTDLKPAAFYAVLMYGLSVFSTLFENWHDIILLFKSGFFSNSITNVLTVVLSVLTPRADYLRITLRLVLIVQLSAMFFRSTSSMEIREALPENRFTEYIVLFLCFIPEIFSSWSLINKAWKARGGKQGLQKIKLTVFVLITLSFEKAAVKAKALAARSGIYTQ